MSIPSLHTLSTSLLSSKYACLRLNDAIRTESLATHLYICLWFYPRWPWLTQSCHTFSDTQKQKHPVSDWWRGICSFHMHNDPLTLPQSAYQHKHTCIAFTSQTAMSTSTLPSGGGFLALFLTGARLPKLKTIWPKHLTPETLLLLSVVAIWLGF